jgi:hypothetical protein
MLTITDDIATIKHNINMGIADYINSKLSSRRTALISGISRLIPKWINDQPEIASLQSSDVDSLAGQFGLTSSSSIVSSIVDSIVSSVNIMMIPFDRNLNGGLELSFQPSDFSNLLSMSIGHVRYQGGNLHWLDWLLTKGDTIIITNYHYNPGTGLGRSGLGNMTPGGAFRVPPQYSGTTDNNFITRALSGSTQEQEMTKVFSDILGS